MRIGRLLAGVAPVLLTLSIVVPAAAAGSSSPPPLYVMPPPMDGCSDSGTGSYSDPFCTVQAAADVVVPGQTVYVFYQSLGYGMDGDIHLTRSGTPSAPITFKVANNPPEDDEDSPIVVDRGTNGFVLDGVHDVDIDGFQIQGGPYTGAPGVTSTGIVVNNSSDIGINHDFVTLADQSTPGDGVDITGTSSNVTIDDSLINTDRTDVSVGTGVTGTDIVNDIFSSGAFSSAVSVDGAAGTDIVNNTAALGYCPPSVFSVSGGATATSIENNVDTAQCTTATPLLTVAADSTAGTHSDYNVVHDAADPQLYSWGGTDYGTAAQLSAATGQGTHDSNAYQPFSPTFTPWLGPALDSADANAPGILPTDYNGEDRRVDQPGVPNTGTGAVSYVDRGAVEEQDGITLSMTTNTTMAPVGGTVEVTLTTPGVGSPIVDYSVDFGDGTPPVHSKTPTISHTYTALSAEPYQISATATDASGDSASASVWEEDGIRVVEPTPLAAYVNAEPSDTNPAQYTAYVSELAGSWSPTSATCDFGDGSGVQQAVNFSCTHTYLTAGHYVFTATITDAGGETASQTEAINVPTSRSAPQPVPGGQGCKVCY